MTVATLLSAATQQVLGAAVALPAVCPERFTFTLTIAGLPAFYGQATVMGTTDGVDWDQVWVAQKTPDQVATSVSHTMQSGPNYLFLRASLDNIVPGVGASATVTAVY